LKLKHTFLIIILKEISKSFIEIYDFLSKMIRELSLCLTNLEENQIFKIDRNKTKIITNNMNESQLITFRDTYCPPYIIARPSFSCGPFIKLLEELSQRYDYR
jgi:hypothetical protein